MIHYLHYIDYRSCECFPYNILHILHVLQKLGKIFISYKNYIIYMKVIALSDETYQQLLETKHKLEKQYLKVMSFSDVVQCLINKYLDDKGNKSNG